MPVSIEERLRLLEQKNKADTVTSALEKLHRSLDKNRFDLDDAMSDMETLVKSEKLIHMEKQGNMNASWTKFK